MHILGLVASWSTTSVCVTGGDAVLTPKLARPWTVHSNPNKAHVHSAERQSNEQEDSSSAFNVKNS